jgi:hypothetical protein
VKSPSLPILAAFALVGVVPSRTQAQAAPAWPTFIAEAESADASIDAPASSSSAFSSPAAKTAASGSEPSSAAIMSEATPPFFYWGIALKFGVAGAGIDVSAPLNRRLNLRAGVSFFVYDTSLRVDNATITGSIRFQNAAGMVDFFPFRNRFRVSTGLSFYNNTGFSASLQATPGQSFDLANTTYISDPSDPIQGTAAFNFGGRVAPRFTFGFGNMLPKQGRFAVESEFGFAYISQPTVHLQVTGSGCTGLSYTDCGVIDQSDVRTQQLELEREIYGFRFYPIFSVGFSYKIGPTQPKKPRHQVSTYP